MYLRNLEDFLSKEDFDILCLQEVSGGLASYQKIEGRKYLKGAEETFEKIKQKFNLSGELAIMYRIKGDPSSYFGNAILYKKTLKASNKRLAWIKKYEELELSNEDWANSPRVALSLDFSFQSKLLTIVTSHLAWGPTPYDKPYKVKQADILLNYLKTLRNPFILTGDFNLIPETQIVKAFSKLARNLIVEHGITNTLNPRTHRSRILFPEGRDVDYIFASEEIKVKDFKLIDSPDLSDHFGLALTFQV